MNAERSKTALIAKYLRRVARVWSALVWLLALILVLGTRYANSARDQGNAPLDFLIPVALFISLIGLGVAWRWEGWGVLLNLGFYLAILPIYALLHQEWIHFSIMVGLSPVILPGVLFGAAWFLSRKANPLS